MIPLTKGPIPQMLADNAAGWTQVLLDRDAAGEKPTDAERSRYNDPTIKSALIAETHAKCAYCESKMRHVAPGDIEHIVPKSLHLNVWFSWNNLTLACAQCNRRKGDFDGDHDTFVDPYLVNPDDHFQIAGALVLPRPGSDSGKSTEALLELNRADLVERRTQRVKGLMNELDRIKRIQNPVVREIVEQEFLQEASDDKEYAALAREILRVARAKGDFPPAH